MILVQTKFRKTILNQNFIKNPPNFDGFFANHSTQPTIFLGVYPTQVRGFTLAGQTAESETPQPTNDTA